MTSIQNTPAQNTPAPKDPILVVVQLTGANDYMNTIVPYNNPIYYDNRPTVGIPADQVLPIDGDFGFNPVMEPLQELYVQGKMAVINGIGYPNPNRSHFRSMDIWHTAEPEKIATEGWLGKVVRDLDPKAENVLTAVNFGRGMPRALALPGVPVASVGALEGYGVMAGIADQQHRAVHAVVQRAEHVRIHEERRHVMERADRQVFAHGVVVVVDERPKTRSAVRDHGARKHVTREPVTLGYDEDAGAFGTQRLGRGQQARALVDLRAARDADVLVEGDDFD